MRSSCSIIGKENIVVFNTEYFRIEYQKSENDQYQRRIHSMVLLFFHLLAMIQLHHPQ
jgi:hypothetical protein